MSILKIPTLNAVPPTIDDIINNVKGSDDIASTVTLLRVEFHVNEKM